MDKNLSATLLTRSGIIRAGFVAFSFLLLLSCSKLDKDSNCLNDKAACFKADKTAPQFNKSVNPADNATVSVLPKVVLMFTEELNNPQPSDFQFSEPGLTIIAVNKLDSYQYELLTNRNPAQGGTLTLSFPNLKDYNGNKIVNSSVSYTVDIGIPVVTSVDHYGLSAGGYTVMNVNWYHTYTPELPGTTTYSVKVSTGSLDCKDPALTTLTPTSALTTGNGALPGNLVPRDANDLNNTTYKFQLTPATTGITATGAYIILLCVDNVANNKHGTGTINLVRDDNAPSIVTLSPPAGNYAAAQALNFSCSDNSDRIIYTAATNVGQPSDPAAPANPGFTAGVVDVGSTEYLPGNPPLIPYTSNTTRSIYKYRCIDKAGNVSGVTTSGAYRVNDSYPIVNFTSFVKTGTAVGIAGLSTGGYASGTINWSSNQISQPWQLRTDALDCSVAGTVVLSGTTPAVANQTVSTIITPASTNITVAGNYVLRICVSNGTDWAQTSFPLVRDDTQPAVPTVNVAGGGYGIEQDLIFSCNAAGDNVDKLAYNLATQLGASAPAAPTSPNFLPDGTLDESIIGSTLFSTPVKTADTYTSVYRVMCIDKAGNKSNPLTTGSYTIDKILPTVVLVTNSRDYVSNVAGYDTTVFNWRSSRGGLAFEMQLGGTDCTNGVTIAGLTSLVGGSSVTQTPSDVNQVISTTIPASAFATGNNTVMICVKNLINRWGYTAKVIIKDLSPPTLPLIEGMSISQVDATNFTVSWNASSDANGIAGYRIFRSLTSGAYGPTPDYTAVSSPATIAMPDTQPYFLKIIPFDVAGNVPAAGASYTEITTKPTITLVVTGLGSAKFFNLTDGTSSATISANTAGSPWTTSLGTGGTYNFAVTTQPVGQVCAVKELQFGALDANVTLNINCVNGYQTAQSVNVVPAAKLGYRLYQGKNTAIAGSGTNAFANGVGAGASFNFPEFVAHLNGALYVADTNNYRIRKIDLSSNTVTTLAGSTLGAGTAADNGTCAAAKFGQPMGLAADGTNLYVADFDFGRIRKLSDINGTCQAVTLAGTGSPGYNDGAANVAQFNQPRQIVANNDYLYVADAANHRIRRIALATGVVDTLAGTGAATDSNGTGTGAGISLPIGMTLIGNKLYAATSQNHIMSVDINTKVATIVAGDGTAGYLDATGLTSRFRDIYSMTTDGVDLYIGEANNHLIRRVEISQNFKVTTLAGAPSVAADVAGVTGASARFNIPHGIATDGRSLFIANHSAHTIRKLTDNGLVGYWPVDKGVNPFDYSSDGSAPLNGTLVNGPLSTSADRFGTANGASLFTTSQYITTAAPITATGLSACNVSMSFWFKMTATTGANQILAYNGNSGNSGFGFYIDPSGVLSFLFGTNGSYPAYTVAPGVWTHAAATCKNSNQWSVYVNGKYLLPVVNNPTATPPATLYIGANASLIEKLNGAIGDVRVYNRTLNEGEINELAQDAGGTAQVGNSFNTGATGLLAHYEFNAGVEGLPGGPVGGNLGITGPKVAVIGKDGDVNGAISYNGSSNSFTGDGTGLPLGTTPRTICAWVNPASYAGSTMIASYGQSNNHQAFGLVMYNNANIGLSAWNNDVLANATIPLNAWSHVCGTYDGMAATVYRNGVSIATGPFAGGFSTVSGNLIIGRKTDPTGSGNFPGKIDDVRIYNRALSAVEVRQLATQVPSGLLRRFDLNDAVAGGKAVDVAGWGENASIAGATQSADRFQQANQSYNFNGSAQSISGDDIGLPTNTSPRTLCSWIRPTAYPSTFGVIVKYGVGGPSRMDALALQGSTSIAHAGFSADHIVAYKVPLNTWTHLCGTFYSNAGTPTSEIFVNGASLGTDTTALTIGSWGTTLSGGSTLNIGLPDYDANQRFIGDIDDVRIYNRVVSAAEIRALAGYHPMQVTNALTAMKMHFIPETLSALANGAEIAQWDDSSLAGLHMNQGTSTNRPQFAAAAINGRPAVNFNTDRYFTRACSTDLDPATVTIVGMMYKTSTAGGIFKGLFHHGDKLLYFNGSNEQLAWFRTSPDQPRILSVNSYITQVAPGPNMIFSLSYDGTNGNMYKFGQDVSSGPANPTASTACATGLYFGRTSFPVNNLEGHIGDFIYYNTYIADADRRIAECYISAKYSVPMSNSAPCP